MTNQIKAEAGGFLVDADGYAFAATASGRQDHARRLAACWNACSGMPVEHVEALATMGTISDLAASNQRLLVEQAQTARQRDHLRDVLDSTSRRLTAEAERHHEMLADTVDDLGLAIKLLSEVMASGAGPITPELAGRIRRAIGCDGGAHGQ